MNKKLLFLLVLLLTAATGAVAEEQVVYTLDGTQTASNTAYATAGVVNQRGMTWYVTGNVNQNPWRIGGKSLSGVDRPVLSENSLNETVTKVTLEFGEANSITVNSITMTVAGDVDFNNVIDSKAVTFSANNTVDVTPTEGKEWKNAYYRFVFNVTVSGGNNKYFQLKSIKFYNDPDAQQQGGSSTEPVAGTFTVSLKDGVKDADKWTVSPAANVKKGTEVTVTYSGTKKVIGVKAEKKASTPSLSITSPVVGQVIGSDGKNYAAASVPSGVTKVAMIAYVSGSNGLAIALSDEGSLNWETAKSTCEAKTPAFTNGTWKLPSQDEWKQMFSANGGDEGNYTGLNTTITNAGGTTFPNYSTYWSSSESDPGVKAYRVNFYDGSALWSNSNLVSGGQVRACLAF